MMWVGDGAPQKRIGRSTVWPFARSSFSRERRREPSEMVVPMRLRHRKINQGRQTARRHCVLWVFDAGDETCPVAHSWHDPHPAIPDMARHAQSVSQYQGQKLSALGRPRHSNLRALERLCGVLGRHGADLPGRSDHRTRGQQRPLRTGQLHLGSFIRAIKEQTPICRVEL